MRNCVTHSRFRVRGRRGHNFSSLSFRVNSGSFQSSTFLNSFLHFRLRVRVGLLRDLGSTLVGLSFRISLQRFATQNCLTHSRFCVGSRLAQNFSSLSFRVDFSGAFQSGTFLSSFLHFRGRVRIGLSRDFGSSLAGLRFGLCFQFFATQNCVAHSRFLVRDRRGQNFSSLSFRVNSGSFQSGTFLNSFLHFRLRVRVGLLRDFGSSSLRLSLRDSLTIIRPFVSLD